MFRGAIVEGIGTTAVESCSWKERLGLTLNAYRETENLWPMSRVGSEDGKLLKVNIRDKEEFC